MEINPLRGVHSPEHSNLHPNNHSNLNMSGVSFQGQQCYIDMGVFYASNISSCMNWQTSPATVDASLLQKKLLEPLLSQLKAGGVDKINLSFAQISDISLLSSASTPPPAQAPSTSGYSGNDSLKAIFNPDGLSTPYQLSNSPTTPTPNNSLAFMTDFFHQNRIKVDMSFGGANGGGSDMKLPGDPTKTASDLATFMKNTGISSTDFDIENSSLFTENNSSDLNTFFTALHSQLSSSGMTSTATIEGGSVTSSLFSPMMNNFSSKFDGLNLMLYSQTQYNLSAKPSSQWCGVEGAIAAVGGDPSKIHLGFYDSIPYNTPGANADSDSSTYTISPGSSKGSAAAQIYQQLNAQMQRDGTLKPGQSLGEPFVWTDTPGSSSSGQFMSDFYNGLKGIKKPMDLMK